MRLPAISLPGGTILREKTKERECWKFLDQRLISENDSRLNGQPSNAVTVQSFSVNRWSSFSLSPGRVRASAYKLCLVEKTSKELPKDSHTVTVASPFFSLSTSTKVESQDHSCFHVCGILTLVKREKRAVTVRKFPSFLLLSSSPGPYAWLARTYMNPACMDLGEEGRRNEFVEDLVATLLIFGGKENKREETGKKRKEKGYCWR